MSTEAANRPLGPFERLMRWERTITLAALAGLVILGLMATIWTGEWLMPGAARDLDPWARAVLLFVMWWTMMLAMMLPSAAPAILIYGSMRRRFGQMQSASAPAHVFALGYIAVWSLFSLAVALLQGLLGDWLGLTGMMATPSHWFGGGLLMAAGLYQLTPQKQACLRHCQSPFDYLARSWRRMRGGAFALGFSHGLSCLGCCFVLMGLLFYGGVMEPYWIIGLAAYVLAERLIPPRWQVARLTGWALILWGGWELKLAAGF